MLEDKLLHEGKFFHIDTIARINNHFVKKKKVKLILKEIKNYQNN